MKNTPTALTEFYDKRKGSYQKAAQDEDFFQAMNQTLREKEMSQYRDLDIEHPFIFIFGAPRSGTTLISQLLGHSLDCGFINNLMARFWLAPLHGIRLSQAVFGDRKETAFHSDYARTQELTDIHEFGYFWRHWLKKETMADVTLAAGKEETIDWQGLKKVLANMQYEFDKPMVFKNIFGAYHLQKMRETLGKVLYVFIERDPLDTAISILDARNKYYGNPETWWSYTPIEYDLIKNWSYMQQIAGQVYFLHRYYRKQVMDFCGEITLHIRYRDLTADPQSVLRQLGDLSLKNYAYPLTIAENPPASFPFQSYENRPEEKDVFAAIFNELKKKYP